MRWLLTVARKRDVDPNSTWTITSVAIAMYTTLPVDGRNPLWQGILATLLAAVSLILIFVAPFMAVEQFARERGQVTYSYRASYLCGLPRKSWTGN